MVKLNEEKLEEALNKLSLKIPRQNKVFDVGYDDLTERSREKLKEVIKHIYDSWYDEGLALSSSYIERNFRKKIKIKSTYLQFNKVENGEEHRGQFTLTRALREILPNVPSEIARHPKISSRISKRFLGLSSLGKGKVVFVPIDETHVVFSESVESVLKAHLKKQGLSGEQLQERLKHHTKKHLYERGFGLIESPSK